MNDNLPEEGPLCLHASCVAIAGRALLITGPSGAGKSSLALQLMAWGAALICDDQTEIRREGDRLIAARPARLPALIEARGLGLLHADPAPPAPLGLWVDLISSAGPRLPERQSRLLLGVRLEVVTAVHSCHLGPAIWHYARFGRGA